MSDQEDKDRFIEELRRLRRGLDDKDRAARLEELRFAKKQQWYIATSAVTILAAIFGIAHLKPNLYEKIAATVLVALIMGFACWFLCKLQDHLKQTRTLLDPMDPKPWFRGADILGVLVGTVIVSGLVVFYYLCRPEAERLTQTPAAAPMSLQAPAAAPNAPAARREAEEDWGKERWR
jgi:predicted membrane-bound mannosyltransferase